MKKLIVEKIDNYDYTLIDANEKRYILNIEFYSKYKPQINDIFYVDDSIVEEINLYAFDEIYDTSNVEMKDIIKVVNDQNNYYFQRRYG